VRLRRVGIVVALLVVAVLCLVSTTAAAVLLGTTFATVLLDIIGHPRPPDGKDQGKELRVDLSRRRSPRDRARRRPR
jgi:hypothetical protein